MIGSQPADDPANCCRSTTRAGCCWGRSHAAPVHRDGDWHWCFDCWIIAHDAAARPAVLLQQRSLGKDTWPGRWDISAAGHYRPGETLAEGVRELAEELGIEAQPEQLIRLGVRIAVTRQVTATGTIIDREFQDTYFLHDERALSDYRPLPRRGDGTGASPGCRRPGTLDGRDRIADPARPRRRRERVAGSRRSTSWTARSFIPAVDSYLLKVLALAERALKGERLLYI